MEALLRKNWVNNITAIYCSNEQKAIDGADIIANHLGLHYAVDANLGENDRSSTGFLKPAEFERTADEFFAATEKSVRGWETAKSAQTRIVEAVQRIDQQDSTHGDIAIVSHGAVGTLLYCNSTRKPIDRRWDQPGTGGGNYLVLRLSPINQCSWWEPID